MDHKQEQYQDMLARLFPVSVQERDEEHLFGLARTATIQVTDACNLACTYCYQINKGKHVISKDVAKKFIDLLLNATPESCSYINPKISRGIVLEFIGGEPLLEIDLIDELTDYFIASMIKMHHPWATRYRISICSNGVLYNSPKVQEYLLKHKGNVSFSISIDGNKELHDSCRVFPDGTGSYDIAMAASMDYRKRFHSDTGTKMTLAPENIEHTFDAIINLLESGYKTIFANCVYEEGWTADHAATLYYQMKQIADYILEHKYFDQSISLFDSNLFEPMLESDNKNWCGGTGCMLSVDWKGNIYPCIRYMESSLGTDVPPIIIGNVDDGIANTSETKQIVDSLNAITRRSQSTGECWTCPIASGCSWCSAYNYQMFGTVNHRATYICIMHKARALANVYYWNKYYISTNSSIRKKLNVPKSWALEIIPEDEYQMLYELSHGVGSDNL